MYNRSTKCQHVLQYSSLYHLITLQSPPPQSLDKRRTPTLCSTVFGPSSVDTPPCFKVYKIFVNPGRPTGITEGTIWRYRSTRLRDTVQETRDLRDRKTVKQNSVHKRTSGVRKLNKVEGPIRDHSSYRKSLKRNLNRRYLDTVTRRTSVEEIFFMNERY